MKNFFSFILVAIAMLSCQSSGSLDQQIVGRWKMDKVFESDLDMTEKHNPKNDRWIEFKSDGTFVSDGKPFGRNIGRWTTDNLQSILFIDSDVDDDDSEWKVIFEANQTIWTGIGHPRKESTRLVHVKF